MKIMFRPFLDCGRSTAPSLESGRFAIWWLAGHWIPAVFPSLETHTTWPILLHPGHTAWSPILTMSLSLPSSCCPRKASFQLSFCTYRWFARTIYIVYSSLLIQLSSYTYQLPLVFYFEKNQLFDGWAQRIKETLHIRKRRRAYKDIRGKDNKSKTKWRSSAAWMEFSFYINSSTCRNRTTPRTMSAIQRIAVSRIHFLIFIGKSPKA